MKRAFDLAFITCAAVFLLGFLAQQTIAAEVPPDVKTALSAKVSEIMPLLSEGKLDEFLQRVGATSDPDRDYYDEMRRRLSALNEIAGKYLDNEVAGYKTITSRYHVIYLMAYYQKMPVLFEFGFYKVNNEWQPLKIRVETSFQSLLETLPMQKP